MNLLKWSALGLTRTRTVVESRNQAAIKINGKNYINFSSNDYLGLANHGAIDQAYIEGIKHYGFGSGASGIVSGYTKDQKLLEEKFARWLNVDKTLLFNSGYHANIGVLSSLLGRSSVVLADKLCHASILDGIQLSRAKHYRYQHNNHNDFLRLYNQVKPDLIVTESIFSMEGDIVNARILKDDSNIIIDDAHGIGVLGSTGRGIIEQAYLNQHQFACLVAPLGKAFNAMGAIVAGRSDFVETIVQFAKTYRYTTALPPAVCNALSVTLDIVATESWRRAKLYDLIHRFNETAVSLGLVMASSDITPIRSIIIGDNDKVMEVQKVLLEKGFFVPAIRSPTVSKHFERLRVSLNCHHTTSQIINFLEHVSECCKAKH